MIKRTIGIDCRLGGIAHAGIGRYIAELVFRVTQSTQEYSWVLFCTDREQATELLRTTKHNPDVQVIYAPIRQYTLSEQLVLPDIFKSVPLDLLHVPHFNVPLIYNRPIVVTIHDLLWHEYRGKDVTTLHPLTYWPKYWMYRLITREAIRKAKKVLVPTKTVRSTVKRYYPQAADKIVVTYEGIGTHLVSLASKVKKLKRKEKSLLYVGSLYPHKNVSLVLEALQDMPDYNLEIVGARSAFQERLVAEVAAKNLTDQVTFSGRLSDQELARRYATATALIQPSLSEGFGLTGLEALAFGTPVIASDIPIFHEVYQDAATYFSKHSPHSFKAAVQKLNSTSVSKALAQHAREVQGQYSWDRLAEQTLASYEQVLQKTT